MKKHNLKYLLLCAVILFTSCEKFLDETPDKKLAVISSLQDLQALMDYNFTMNYRDDPSGQLSSDDLFSTDAILAAREPEDRNMYIWSPSNIFPKEYNSWNDNYTQVYICNLVLSNAERLKDNISDKAGLEAVKAQAVFHRAKCYFNALTTWSLAYDPATADKDLGIPLVKTTDFNIKHKRASVKEGFEQVTSDLLAIADVMPVKPVHQARPSKGAVYGYLSRVYMYMRDYDKAFKYADEALKLNSTLVDFNTLNAAANFPIGPLNAEVIYEGRMIVSAYLSQARSFINPELYQLYNSDDLRKVIYFKSSGADYVFKGNYASNGSFFSGIAVNELLLNRAECYARIGNTVKAMEDVNLLLKNRIKNTLYVPLTAGSPADALKIVKLERRKEFPYRGLRWLDIKRFNKEGDNIIQTRKFNGVIYTLEPNSLRYALAIPEDVILLSGMTQNPR